MSNTERDENALWLHEGQDIRTLGGTDFWKDFSDFGDASDRCDTEEWHRVPNTEFIPPHPADTYEPDDG